MSRDMVRSALSPRMALAGFLLFCPAALAGERFVHVPLSGLRFADRSPELPLERAAWTSGAYLPWGVVHARAVLDGPGEVYLDSGAEGTEPWSDRWRPVSAIALRTEADGPVRGRLFAWSAKEKTVESYPFELALPEGSDTARRRFLTAKARHYEILLEEGRPGAAWFRHQRDAARKALGSTVADGPGNGPIREPADPLDLFTGARAVAENLDLDRGLPVVSDAEATVPVSSIEGVTTRALDWKALVKDLKPELDPLARCVPADQHVVFFPSFEALTRVADELDATGGGLIDYFEARTEDQLVKERYTKQLCLPFSTLGRLLGPTVVSSVALTGSDPFLPSGADVVVLFECKLADVLEKFVSMRHAEAVKNGADPVQGQVMDVAFAGAVSNDRSVSSYMARLDQVVVVTNSLPALLRTVECSRDAARSILAADEYVWFRDRYRRGAAGESALIVLTDATIRRWAGPRSRIAEARRTRAAAAMTEISSRHADELVGGKLASGTSAADADFPVSADFVWDADGVRSQRFGSLRFLTPLAEIGVEKVSPAERDAYERYRQSFQARWRNYFDPICVRLSFDAARLSADVTIMPLTIDTEYRELRELTLGGELLPLAGDPHEGALVHFASAFNKSSELGRMLSGATGSLAERFGADPLGWLGASMAVYAEQDAWWQEIVEQGGLTEADDVDFARLPVVVQLDVKDPLRLAAFVTALRATVDESAPNMTRWENRTWNGVTYVCITPNDSLGLDSPDRPLRIFYATLPDVFVLTLREDLLQKAIDRRAKRKAGEAIEGGDRTWIGKSAGLRFQGGGIQRVFEFLDGRGDRRAEAAWSTIPILNEWKERYPDEDPVRVHERLFGVRLTTPSGRPLVWNEEFRTMESPDHGRPGAPRQTTGVRRDALGVSRAELGLEFEAEGLRARVELEKATK